MEKKLSAIVSNAKPTNPDQAELIAQLQEWLTEARANDLTAIVGVSVNREGTVTQIHAGEAVDVGETYLGLHIAADMLKAAVYAELASEPID